jgi:hypothetical protein
MASVKFDLSVGLTRMIELVDKGSGTVPLECIANGLSGLIQVYACSIIFS